MTMELIHFKGTLYGKLESQLFVWEAAWDSFRPIEKLGWNGKEIIGVDTKYKKDIFDAYYGFGSPEMKQLCRKLTDTTELNVPEAQSIPWIKGEFWRDRQCSFAFECSPKSFNYLCANIALNTLDYKVTKFNCALSNETGTTPYYIRDPNDGGGNGISKFEYDNIKNTPHIDVPKNTLDSYNLTNVGFIKIDVEGHEKEVLEGSVETIKNNNYPKILFESWDEHQEKNNFPAIKLRQELFDFIKSLGYNIIRIGQDMYLAER